MGPSNENPIEVRALRTEEALEELKSIDFILILQYMADNTKKGRLGKSKMFASVKMAEKALEKQIPREVSTWNGQYQCPECHKLFGNKADIDELGLSAKNSFCKYCGKALNWRSTNG